MKILDFQDVAAHRVSTRKYNQQIPDQAAVQKVIDAALLAPIVSMHKFHLSVVTNKEAMDMAEEAAYEFLKAKTRTLFMYGAPVWIIVSGEKHMDADSKIAEIKNNNLFWNVGAIIENMALQATALGLANCMMNATIVAMADKPAVKKAVGIPEGYEALGSLIIGYSDTEVPKREVNYDIFPVSYVK